MRDGVPFKYYNAYKNLIRDIRQFYLEGFQAFLQEH